MLSGLLSLFTSPILGGVVGFLGSWLTKREERKTLQINLTHTVTMAELNHRNKINELKAEGDIADIVVQGEAFKSSQTHGNTNSGVKWVDGVRSLMRPLITTYLLAIASYLGYALSSMVGGLDSLNPSEILALYKEIVLSLLALTNLAISWWFGSRGSSKKGNTIN
jgi:hypothetical protein